MPDSGLASRRECIRMALAQLDRVVLGCRGRLDVAVANDAADDTLHYWAAYLEGFADAGAYPKDKRARIRAAADLLRDATYADEASDAAE